MVETNYKPKSNPKSNQIDQFMRLENRVEKKMVKNGMI